MESMSLMFYLEIGLIVLLLAGLFYMHIINKKLKMLKSGGDGFKAVVIELNHATDNAQMAIQGLKLTVRDAEHGLDGNLKEARSIAEELKYLLEQAKIYGDGIDLNNPRNLPQMSDNVRNTPAATVPQNRAKNFADQTLEKVARQKQSLPNPIVHSAQDRFSRPGFAAEPASGPAAELGVNLEPAHKEMALESRDLVLKSIAARKTQANERAMQGEASTNLSQLQQNVSSQPTASPLNLARNIPMPRPRQTAAQPTIAQPTAARATEPSQHSHNGSNGSSGMSLSDMVGRHAALEKRAFAQVDDSPARSENAANEAPGRGKSAGQIKSLFQRLSETR
ncbi:MAG: hypothetical protein HRU29_05420 [Rhizobiales bacterium]|nr:DUF6468 domain-containing protein [Hyphomicrobiales bacterium]NRB13823.1 hypothetical protein [Hyphomicrobiales bacterium]